MKILRNKSCKECPQNKREDVVWKKGYEDGIEAGLYLARELMANEIQRRRDI